MKKLKSLLCFMLIAMFIAVSFSVNTFAAITGQTRIGCSDSNPMVGDAVTVTVTYTLNQFVNGVSGNLRFTSENLEFVSAENANLSAPGVIELVNSGNASKVYNFTVNFKAIGDGRTELILNNCLASDGVEESSEIVGQSVVIYILSGNEGNETNPDNNASSNANLKSITVSAGTLTPAFSPNITEYNVTVPYENTDGILYCQAVDSGSRFTFKGNRELAVGITKRSITVTAPDGTTKVYNVTFNRLDENGNDTTLGVLDGIEVEIDGKKYTITDDFADITAPTGFSVGILNYSDNEVACLTDASGKINLVYLVDSETEEKRFFLYSEEDGFSPFNYIESGDNLYIVLNKEDGFETPNGYYASNYEFNGFIADGFKSTDEALKDFIIIRAQAPGGEAQYYRYDTKEHTLQRYLEFGNEEKVVSATGNVTVPEKRKYLIIALLLVAAELILAILITAIVLIIRSIKAKNQAEQEDYEIDMQSFETEIDSGREDWLKVPEDKQ